MLTDKQFACRTEPGDYLNAGDRNRGDGPIVNLYVRASGSGGSADLNHEDVIGLINWLSKWALENWPADV